MIREFALPDLGEGLTESEIVSWKVAEGQRVALNQVIAEVETAKAVVQLPSPWDGVVERLLHAEGATVDVGTPILAIDVPSADGTGTGEGAGESGAGRREPTLVGYGAAPAGTGRPARRRRAAGGGAFTGALTTGAATTSGLAATGSPAGDDEPGQPGVPDVPRHPDQPDTDQPDPGRPDPGRPDPGRPGPGRRPEEPGVPLPGHTPDEPPLPSRPDEPLRPGGPEVPLLPGSPDEPLSPNGPEVPPLPGGPELPPRPGTPGAPRPGEGDALATAPHDGHRPAGASGAPRERRLSTPIVRKLARDLGVDLESLTGTGRGGLVTREDVTAAAAAPAASAPATSPPAPPAPSAPAPATEPTAGVNGEAGTGDARETREPIRGVRKSTATAMVTSAFTAPHVTEFLTVDVTESVALLASLRADRAWAEDRPTMTALVSKAVLVALRRHPELNSRWDEAAGEIVRFGYVNLGIAAATPRGLVVPNLKDADRLDLRALTGALRDLTTAARDGRTTPAAMSGGTFTISNVGVFGVDAGTPILNPGEAGILATGQVRRTPWEYRGEIALREVMTLSLSFDHRLVDGEAGSRFLADVGAVLRAPGATLTLV